MIVWLAVPSKVTDLVPSKKPSLDVLIQLRAIVISSLPLFTFKLALPLIVKFPSMSMLSADDFGITPTLISEVSSKLSDVVSDVDVQATVNSVVNDTTMDKLNQIEQQQIFIKKESDNVFSKISEGISNLADKIVAKIDEGRVINTTVVAQVDEGVLFRTVTKEIDGRQIPTQLAEEAGAAS